MKKLNLCILLSFLLSSLYSNAQVITGAEHTAEYIPLIENKNIALVVNQTSVIKNVHLLDTLRSLNIKVVKIFTPEHGFRGTSDAGEPVPSYFDKQTGIEVISLYGKNKKPGTEQLKNVDILLFDIQDVGVRFYTYISTLHYVMEAAAENNKQVIVLDRPNPNGHYIDGPVLDTKFKSFVGMHPVPIVHGLTIGEYAQMINGEAWLAGKKKCSLTVVPCQNYTHTTHYTLPIPPSPNLPNQEAIYLYPSLCLFEGTVMSVGRGTDFPFQQFGHPAIKGSSHSFTPESREGAKDPIFKGQVCYGYNVKRLGTPNIGFTLRWLLMGYLLYPNHDTFFNSFFDKLAGTSQLRLAILEGKAEDEIKKEWKPAIDKYKLIRKKYLLYEDFE